LTLVIPEYWRRDLEEIPNNLPVPEFDDTGFIGRRAEREAVLRLLHGAHRVVTVTGEGGVGKTSLALQVLYDVASDHNRPFDQIVWVTLKTEQLTTAGAREIADALATPEGLLRAVAETGGPTPVLSQLTDWIAYVVELLGHFRVLLAIDNLETINRDDIRPLFLDLPATSKIILTSRFGLGEFETRYPLAEMNRIDAVRLLRSMARLLNTEGLSGRPDSQLAEVCERLFYNPLAIRWFVQSYSEGRSVSDLLERRRSLADVLKFCFHTLYESLSDEHRAYLRILVAVGKPLSEVQIALLHGATSLEEVRSALHYLQSSNLVRRVSDEWATAVAGLWTTSEFARAYIVGRDSQVLPDRPRIVRQYKSLMRARDEARAVTYSNPFRSMAIDAQTTDQASVVYLLQQALVAGSRGEYRAALEAVNSAKRLQPGFYEVWRVSGQVLADRDPSGARQEFEHSLELADGRSQPLLVFVAQFLVDQDEAMEAVEILETAAASADADPRLVVTYARSLGLSGNLGRALSEFERVSSSLELLGGRERAVWTTQYAEALRRAADAESQRHLPDKAMIHLLRALDLAVAACQGNYVDRVLVTEARACIEVACRLVSRQCSIEMWSELHGRLAGLRDFVALSTLGEGPDLIRLRCPVIVESAEFKATLGERGTMPVVVFGDVLEPGIGRDYTFIRADDGLDYFLHRSVLAGEHDWSKVGQPGWTRVRFEPGLGRSGKSPPARAATLIRLEDE
jgi:LuxR family glucitol operon transcriptional activator